MKLSAGDTLILLCKCVYVWKMNNCNRDWEERKRGTISCPFLFSIEKMDIFNLQLFLFMCLLFLIILRCVSAVVAGGGGGGGGIVLIEVRDCAERIIKWEKNKRSEITQRRCEIVSRSLLSWLTFFSSCRPLTVLKCLVAGNLFNCNLI